MQKSLPGSVIYLTLFVFVFSPFTIHTSAQSTQEEIPPRYSMVQLPLNSVASIQDIVQDEVGYMWMATDRGLARYNGDRISFLHCTSLDCNHTGTTKIQALSQDSLGTLWYGGIDFSLQSYNPMTHEHAHYPIPTNHNRYPSRIYHIQQMKQSNLLLCAMDRSFGIFSTTQKKFIQLYNESNVKTKEPLGFIYHIAQDPILNDTYWISGTAGIFVFSGADSTIRFITSYLQNQTVYDFTFNPKGNVIAGDTQGMIYEIDRYTFTPSIIYRPSSSYSHDLSPRYIDYYKNRIRIGSNAGPLLQIQYRPDTKEYVKISEAPYTGVVDVFLDHQNRTWIIGAESCWVESRTSPYIEQYAIPDTLSNGMVILNVTQACPDCPIYATQRSNSKVLLYHPATSSWSSLTIPSPDKDHKVYPKEVYAPSDTILFITSSQGVYQYHSKRNTFQLLSPTESFTQLTVFDNLILYAYSTKGRLFTYHLIDKRKSMYSLLQENSSCHLPYLRQNRDMEVGQDGSLWIGGRPYIVRVQTSPYCADTLAVPYDIAISSKGAKCLSIKGDTAFFGIDNYGIIGFYAPNRLPKFSDYHCLKMPYSKLILEMAHDPYKNNWYATSSGLYVENNNKATHLPFPIYFPKGEHIVHDPRVLVMAPSGFLFFAGRTVITSIKTKEVFQTYTSLPPLIESINYGSTTVQYTAHDTPPQNIVVPYSKNTLHFCVSNFAYSFTTNQGYYVKLEPYHKEWVFSKNGQFSLYEIPSGSYTLHLRESSEKYKTRSIKLRVRPPWYRSIAGVILWIILGSLFIILTATYYTRKKIKGAKLALLLQLKEWQRTLYLNMTHELRTPLSLIISTCTDLLPERPTSEQQIKTIQRNASIIHKYVDQLLEISALEQGSYDAEKKQIPLLANLRLIHHSLIPLAEQKNVTLHFISQKNDHIIVDIDEKSFRKIISPLYRFMIEICAEHGELYLIVSQIGRTQVKIQLKSKTYLISEEEFKNMFDKYTMIQTVHHQSSTRLAFRIIDELLPIYKGKLNINSTPQIGTDITVLLQARFAKHPTKISKETFTVEENEQSSIVTTEHQIDVDNEYSVLLIEDHKELRQYLIDLLGERYDVYCAPDGESGINLATAKIPSLIISDVMMPKVDGFEVCNRLKSDWRTCMIPIVLLTARADYKSHQTGITVGADAFLTKPFDPSSLLLLCENLITNRNLVLQRDDSEKERLFSITVKSFIHLVEDQINDPELSVATIIANLGCSRSTLYRQVSEELQMSPSEYIQMKRIQKAKYLLLKTDFPINEIAVKCGILSPAYFSKFFYKNVGRSPSDFRKNG